MRKRNISTERLIEAIKEYIDGKGSFDTIAEKYSISYETIRNAFIRYKENGITTFIESKHNASRFTVPSSCPTGLFAGLLFQTKCFLCQRYSLFNCSILISVDYIKTRILHLIVRFLRTYQF